MDYNKACEILELKTTDSDEIKRNYRKLAMKYHPDKNTDGEDQFKKIQEAYTFLTKSPEESINDNTDVAFNFGANLFSNIFSNNSNFLNNFINNINFPNSCTKNNDSHIKTNVSITIKEFFYGGDITVSFTRKYFCEECYHKCDTCKDCNGVGKKIIKNFNNGVVIIQPKTCESCLGDGFVSNCSYCCKGFISRDITKTVYLPGNNNYWGSDYLNKPLILKGEGHEVVDSSSDLLVYISVSDPEYEIKENNMYITKTINLKESLLGIGISINLFDDSHIQINNNNFIIKEGDGYKFKRKGIYDINGKRGDLFVVFKINCPKRLSKDQWKAINELF